ncbi:hypothetical protein SteCoe_36864 [Stentor coeruleus]|uniref:non-specific serine/threonine protein kinase n=1 Tax=Stentor coeruleus TaxID=5963 RepID=A0A1R2APB3_9CILI|nr:hypothetical protein SteCoe_36864 [Stentor coeruleus]
MGYADFYCEIDVIGNGAYGQCMLVQEIATGKKYVAKKIHTLGLSKEEVERSKLESDLLKQLRHPHIVSYKDSYFEGHKVIIIMEYCESGDLAKLIKKHADTMMKFTEPQVLVMLSQLVSALEFVHSRKILHRDIKTSNIFLSADGSLKLGDFGISKVLNSSVDLAYTLVGTPLNMSPELCNHQPYATKSDVWALGCVFYEICALKPPFASLGLLSLVNKITKESPEPLPDCYSENLKELIYSMLIKDADARMSTKELASDPVFADFLFNPMQSIESNIPNFRDSCLNPLELCNPETALPTLNAFEGENADELSVGEEFVESSASDVDDTDIPQDERSNDDENVVIESNSGPNILSPIKKTGKSYKPETQFLETKKNDAHSKFPKAIFRDIYEFIKQQRMLKIYEDIIFSTLIEKYTHYSVKDFLLVDQIIYHEENL